MVKVNVGGCSSFVKDADYKKYLSKALDAFDVLESETGAGNDFLGWKHIPTATPESLVADCEAIRDSWRAKGVNLVVVIGIGGSYLGAKCAIEALSHSFAKQLASAKGAMEIVFAGHNLSEEYMSELMDLMKERNTAAVVISKSGTTTEPAVAFRIVKNYLENKYGKGESASRIVAVTDAKRGALKSLATQEGYKTFVIEDNVGGRFSVLTAVGLLPIAVSGADIDSLMAGAAAAAEDYKNDDINSNDCYKYAALRNAFYRRGYGIELLACYEPRFALMNEWYKQLYGESEGKDHKGLFPASVVFSTDLHSMGQYIQDGRRMLFETVVSLKNCGDDITIKANEDNGDGLNFLAGKTMSYVNEKAFLGTVLAHTDGGVPNIIIDLDKTDEEHLGRLIYFFEKACGISGYLLGVNPFDQPGVESYKKNMFALLGKPGYENEKSALEQRLKD